MTKTSQQLAEELARKCAIDIDLFVMNAPRAKNQEEALVLLSNSILQSIPLVELVECVKVAQMVVDKCHTGRMRSRETYGLSISTLDNLTTKLKQLGIEI